MASKTYYAATKILWGDPKSETGEVTVIEQDSKVTGLPPDVMKQLWDGGSLYTKESDERTTVDGTSSVPTQTSSTTPASPAN